MKLSLILLWIMAVLGTSALARRSNAEILDLNEDGFLTEWEVKVGIQARMNALNATKYKSVNFKALHKKLAPNHSKVTAESVGELDANATEAGFLMFKEMQPSQRNAHPLAEVNIESVIGRTDLPDIDEAPDTTSMRNWSKPKIKIRRSVDDFKKRESDEFQPAIGSYSHDFNSDQDVWTFHGAAGIEFRYGRNSQLEDRQASGPVGGWDYITILPSVSFDKVFSQKDHKTDVDALAFRLGLGGLHSNAKRRVVDGNHLEARVTLATDSGGDRQVFGGEIDWTPILLAPRKNLPQAERDRLAALGIVTNEVEEQHNWFTLNAGLRGFPFDETGKTNPLFLYGVTLTIHAEGGSVLDDGGDAQLVVKDDYFRVGPLAGIRVIPYAFPQLSFNLNYRWYYEIAGSVGSTEMLNASIEWDIFNDKHFVLTLDYRQGRDALLAQEDNTLVLALGVKF